jgi:protein-tyrosine phosphatase
MAERLLALALRRRGGAGAADLVLTSSAGTGDWHVGSAMQPAAARQVRSRGGDPDRFAARQVQRDHLDSADLILTATAEQVDYVLGLRPDACARTFVLGEFARLAAGIDRAALPAGGNAHAVYARGHAVVAAVDAARASRPSQPQDDLDDPYGRSDSFYAMTADLIEATTDQLAELLLG